MAKGKVASKLSDNKLTRYLRETRSELRKVHWPTREEAWNLTKIVMLVTAGMALLLGVLDYLFALGLGGLVGGSVVAIVVLAVALVGGVVAAVVLSRQGAR